MLMPHLGPVQRFRAGINLCQLPGWRIARPTWIPSPHPIPIANSETRGRFDAQFNAFRIHREICSLKLFFDLSAGSSFVETCVNEVNNRLKDLRSTDDLASYRQQSAGDGIDDSRLV